MSDNFTVEEMNFLWCMKKSSRKNTIENIENAKILFDREMKRIADSVLGKLNHISEDEFLQLPVELAE